MIITASILLWRETDVVNAVWGAQDVSSFAGRREVEVVGEAASTSLQRKGQQLGVSDLLPRLLALPIENR